MPSVLAENSYVMTGAEATIASTGSNYVVVARVDLSNMAAGDVITLRMKAAVRNGGSQRTFWEETFSGAQSDPNKQSIPVSAPYGAILTGIQTAGTLRSIDYTLDAIA